MEKLVEFKDLLKQKAKSQVPIQTEWVEVKSVDWEEKTMVAIGQENGLDYDDILLGLGNSFKKPVKGSMAIIGIINNSAAAYMIDCEEVEEIEIVDKTGFKWHLKDGNLSINGVGFGGLLKAPELKTELDKMTARIDGIMNAINNGIPAPGASDGGAGLHTSIKTALSSIVDNENFGSIENDTIKHGNG